MGIEVVFNIENKKLIFGRNVQKKRCIFIWQFTMLRPFLQRPTSVLAAVKWRSWRNSWGFGDGLTFEAGPSRALNSARSWFYVEITYRKTVFARFWSPRSCSGQLVLAGALKSSKNSRYCIGKFFHFGYCRSFALRAPVYIVQNNFWGLVHYSWNKWSNFYFLLY